MKENELSAVVAVAQNGIIGRNNTLPWKLRADLIRFKRLTMGHSLIMGRKTFDSIGKPLPGRQTIVLSRTTQLQIDGVRVVDCIESAIELVPSGTTGFVVGGAEIYQLAMPWIRTIYLTRVLANIEGDAFWTEWDLSQFDCKEQAYLPADAANEWPTLFQHLVRR